MALGAWISDILLLWSDVETTLSAPLGSMPNTQNMSCRHENYVFCFLFSTRYFMCARRRKINNSLYFQYEFIISKFRSIYLIVLACPVHGVQPPTLVLIFNSMYQLYQPRYKYLPGTVHLPGQGNFERLREGVKTSGAAKASGGHALRHNHPSVPTRRIRTAVVPFTCYSLYKMSNKYSYIPGTRTLIRVLIRTAVPADLFQVGEMQQSASSATCTGTSYTRS